MAALPEAQRLSRYKRTGMQRLDMSPWGDSRFTGAVVLEGLLGPQVLASRKLPDDSILIFVARSLGEIASVDGDRLLQFLLLGAVGSLLILGGGGLLLYLSAIRHARDLASASTTRARTWGTSSSSAPTLPNGSTSASSPSS